MPVIGEMSPEYPEFEGSDKVALCTTHQGVSDSFLYKSVKNAVIKRADKIDVWFESPAVELIQDPDSRIVVGVKVTRNGETATCARWAAWSSRRAASSATPTWRSSTSA